MSVISFTLEQINELLAELGKLPYIHSAHLIAGIKQIAEPQFAANVAEKQQSEDAPKEPDTSLS